MKARKSYVVWSRPKLAGGNDANESYYGRKVTPKEILAGRVAAPPGANALRVALDHYYNSRARAAAPAVSSALDVPDLVSVLPCAPSWNDTRLSGNQTYGAASCATRH